MKKATDEELIIARTLHEIGTAAIIKAMPKGKRKLGPKPPRPFEELEPQIVAGWIAIVRHVKKKGLCVSQD